MSGINKTIRIPHPHHDQLAERAKQAGFENENAYLVGLAREDGLRTKVSPKSHAFGVMVSRLPLREQDAIDTAIARYFHNGEPEMDRGNYKSIKDMVEDILKFPERAELIAAKLIDRLLKL